MCEAGSKQLYRNRLINLIRDNTLICKDKFGGRTLLATESEPSVAKVIGGLELILQDGLKPKAPVTLKNMNLNVNSFTLRYSSTNPQPLLFSKIYLQYFVDMFPNLYQVGLVWLSAQEHRMTSQVTHFLLRTDDFS